LELRHVQFASAYLKNETLKVGEPVSKPEVLHWGVDLERFCFKPSTDAPPRLLFVGQVVPHKGLDTAIEALRILIRGNGPDWLTLTVVGGSVYPSYVSELREKVGALGLEGNIKFVGSVPYETLPQIYRAHDILLFPSLVDEGLGMSILEAMASGLVVVGTASGGSSEILVDGQTGLVFPKHDAPACAAQVFRLLEDRALYNRLRLGARRAIEDHFEIENIMDHLENSLRCALELER
jgi:glycosyltransferase involved in cell wall biosynthesis